MYLWDCDFDLILVTSFMEDNIIPLHCIHCHLLKTFCHTNNVKYYQCCHLYIINFHIINAVMQMS